MARLPYPCRTSPAPFLVPVTGWLRYPCRSSAPPAVLIAACCGAAPAGNNRVPISGTFRGRGAVAPNIIGDMCDQAVGAAVVRRRTGRGMPVVPR